MNSSGVRCRMRSNYVTPSMKLGPAMTSCAVALREIESAAVATTAPTVKELAILLHQWARRIDREDFHSSMGKYAKCSSEGGLVPTQTLYRPLIDCWDKHQREQEKYFHKRSSDPSMFGMLQNLVWSIACITRKSNKSQKKTSNPS